MVKYTPQFLCDRTGWMFESFYFHCCNFPSFVPVKTFIVLSLFYVFLMSSDLTNYMISTHMRKETNIQITNSPYRTTKGNIRKLKVDLLTEVTNNWWLTTYKNLREFNCIQARQQECIFVYTNCTAFVQLV